MLAQILLTLLSGAANVLAVLVLAPLFEGLLRKLTARIQSRQGPPVAQPYFDLLKLLGKEDLESGEIPRMQRFAVYLALASTLTVAWFIPMSRQPPLNEAGDVVLLIYLLTLCSISTMLAGLAAGSTYSLLGINREMMTVMTLEPLLVVALVIGAIHVQSFRLDVVLNGSVYAAAHFPWSGAIMFIVILICFQAFVQRVPFDIPEAETEIMGGPLVEYSGPKLALLKYAQMAKLVIYGSLVVSLFLPWGQGLPFPLNGLVFWAKVSGLVLLVTLVAATHARYRIDQAIRFYAGMLGIAFLALILAIYGY